jgi:hypothetical protein
MSAAAWPCTASNARDSTTHSFSDCSTLVSLATSGIVIPS